MGSEGGRTLPDVVCRIDLKIVEITEGGPGKPEVCY